MSTGSIINWDAFGQGTISPVVNENELKAVAERSARNVAAIKQIQAEQIAFKKQEDASWSGQLGLDPNGFADGVVNAAANVAEMTGTILGQIGSTFHTTNASAIREFIPDVALEARKRQLEGNATPKDLKILNDTGEGNMPSYLDRIKELEEAQRSAKDAREFWTQDSWFNETITRKSRKNEMIRDAESHFQSAKADWDLGMQAYENGDLASAAGNVISGIAKGIAGVGSTAWENPQATVELIANQIPQFAAGMLFGTPGMLATSLVYAVDEYSKGVEAFKKVNGRNPNKDENLELAGKASTLMAAEFIGQYATLGAGKKLIGSLDKAAAARPDTSGFKNLLLGAASNPVTRTAAAAIEGGTGEFATEAYQTAMEKNLVSEEASPEDIYVGGVMGALGGGGISAGARSAAEMAGVVESVANNLPKEQKPDEVVTKAGEDVAKLQSFVDTLQDTSLTSEQRAANLDIADESMSRLERELAIAEDELVSIQPEVRANAEKTLNGLKERLAALPEGTPVDQRQALEAKIANVQAFMDTPEATPEQKAVIGKRVQALRKQVTDARTLHQQLTGNIEAAPDELEDSPEAVSAQMDQVIQAESSQDAQVQQTAVAAANKVISLAMRSPTSVSAEQAQTILSSVGASLPEYQQKFLRTLSDAKVAENALKNWGKVSNQVLAGDPQQRMIGVYEYQRRVGTAITRGKEADARKLTGMLGKFADDHMNKAKALAEAYRLAKKTNTNQQIQKNQVTGEWFVTDELLTGEARARNGALTVGASKNYEKVVARLRVEANTIRAARVALDAAVDARFAPAVSSESTQATSVDSEAATAAPVNTELSVESQNQSNVDSTVDSEVSEPSTITTAQDARSSTQVSESTEDSFPKATAVSEVPAHVPSGVRVTGPKLKENGDLTRRVGRKIAELRVMAQDAGWSQVGGKLLRDAAGNVTGRTTWIPSAEWFGAGMEGRPDVLRDAIEAVQAGQNVYAKQRRTIEAMLDWLAYQQGEQTADEDSSIYDFDDLPDIENAQEIAEIIDELYDPEAGSEVTIEDIEREIYEEQNGTEAQSKEVTTSSPDVDGQDDTRAEEADEDVSGQSDVQEEEASGSDEAKGKLEVFRRVADPKLTKLTEIAAKGLRLVTYYTQSSAGDRAQSKRPLVEVKDLLDTLRSDRNRIYDFLPMAREEVTPEQRKTLLTFLNRAGAWDALIQSSLYDPTPKKDGDAEFSFRKPLSDFIQVKEDGSLDMEQNVKIAVAYAVFGLVGELAGRGSEMTEEQVNLALGREDYKEVTQAEFELVSRLGSRVGPVRTSMGQRVMQSLGIRPKKNAPLDDLARMEAAFGSLALALARQTGLFKTELVSGEELNDAAGDSNETLTLAEANEASKKEREENQVKHEFIDLAREEDRRFTKNVQDLLDATKGSKGVLDQFFGSEPRQTAPVFEPPKFDQKETKLGMGIPKEQRELLNIANSRPWRLNKNAWFTLIQMTEEAVIEMAGGVRFDPSKHHIDNEKSMNSKYEGLRREWRAIQEFVNYHLAAVDPELDAPFYLKHEVWAQQRVGIDSALFNPQMSKLARFLSAQEGWESEVDTQNPDSLNNFKLRVLEGLGVKTGNELNETSLLRLPALFDPTADMSQHSEEDQNKVAKLNAAVDALVKAKSEELTEADYAAIYEGVKEGGEKMHTFNALQGVAELRAAQKAVESKFKATVLGEIDGVSNGPVLAHAYYGAAASIEDLTDFLKRGGFYTESDNVSGYNDWRRQPGMLDIYENMTATADEILTNNIATEDDSTKHRAVKALIGDLMKKGTVTKQGRDLSKDPVRPLVFGSSLFRAIESMGESFVENLRKKIEKLPDGMSESDRIARANFINAFNALVSRENQIHPNTRKADLLATRFTAPQILEIKKSFRLTFGSAFKEAVETELEHFLKAREEIKRTSGLIASLYRGVYASLREAFVQELLEKGELEAGKTGKPIQDLSREQEAELQKRINQLTPYMHTAFSMGEKGKGLSSGLPIMYREYKPSEDFRYVAETPLNGVEKGEGLTPKGRQWSYTTPGVRMTSMPIHSSDAAKSFRGNVGYLGLNNHDAITMGLDIFTQIGNGLNKATWDTMLAYSPMAELTGTLERIVQVIPSLMKQHPSIAESLAKELVEFSMKMPEKTRVAPMEVINVLSGGIADAARNADINKYGMMSQLTLVDQYSSEGAGYQVSEEDRTNAKQKLEETLEKPLLSASTENAIKALSESLTSAIEPLYEKALAKEELKNAYKSLTRLRKVELMQLLQAVGTANAGNPDQAVMAEKVRAALFKVENLTQALSRTKLKEEQADALVMTLDAIRKDNASRTWSEEGRPQKGQNSYPLIKLLESAGGSASAKDVLKVLRTELEKAKDANKSFNLALLNRLESLVDDSLKITMITPQTDPSLLLDPEAFTNALGMYQSTGDGRQEIYVLGNRFSNSKVDTELLLHEILHSVLFRVLETSKEPNVLEAKAELEALLEKARDHVNSLENAPDVMVEGTKNLHEFISYGMTNLQFQNTVLRQMPMDQTILDKFKDGFKGFVASMVKLLFPNMKRGSEMLENGLGQFVFHVSSILDADLSNKEYVSGSLAHKVLNEYTTRDVFNALKTSTTSPSFAEHVESILEMMVEKLNGPLGTFKASLFKTAPTDAMDVWTQALVTGQSPFASQMDQSGFSFTEQERFVAEQIEATIRSTLEDSASQTSLAVKELRTLYAEARKVLTPEALHGDNWATASQAEKDAAQALHDFLFKMELGADGTSDYLSRFVALGLAHPRVNALLRFETARTQKIGPKATISQRLLAAFEAVLEWITNTVNHTKAGEQADVKLKKLAKRLVDIEMVRKRKLAQQAARKDLTGPLDRTAQKVSNTVRDTVLKAANSSFVQNKLTGYGQLAGAVVSVMANNQTVPLAQALMKLNDRYITGKQGLVSGILKEIVHPSILAQRLYRHTKTMEQLRQGMISNTRKNILGAFANKGADLSSEKKAAVTYAFLRTDLQSLIDDYTLVELQELLQDPQKLDAEIAKYKAQIKGMDAKFGTYYTEHAIDLGYFLATGISRIEVLSRNAGNIARLFGTEFRGQVSEQAAQKVEPMIDKLVSLYAIKYSSISHKTLAAEVLATENAREDGNGIENMLKDHRVLIEKARNTIFKGKDALMHKGYLPEIVNPYNEMVVRDLSEAKELEAKGYKFIAPLWKDPTDPDSSSKGMFLLRDGGLNRRLSGMMSLTGTQRKGTAIHSGFMGFNEDGRDNAEEMVRQRKLRHPTMRKLMKERKGYSPDTLKKRFMLPIFNPRGITHNFVYVMEDNVRDVVLERDNRFEELLGSLAGSIFDKQETPAINRDVLTAFKDVFDNQLKGKTKGLVNIGQKSTDPELRELYAQLPETTRMDLNSIWGKDGMWVQPELVDIIFGYRKLSLSSIWEKDYENRDIFEKMFSNTVEYVLYNYARHIRKMPKDKAEVFTQRAANMVKKTERAWGEIVQKAKTNIVIRTVVVLWDNEVSNTIYLKARGMSLKEILYHRKVAIQAAREFQDNYSELFALEMQLESGYRIQNIGEIERRIVELKSKIASNPVKDLIDRGAMPTIAEDIADTDDIYSYKSWLTKKTAKYTNRVSPGIRNAANIAMLGEDTKAFKFLRDMTQLSDFSSRYALYQHLMSQKEGTIKKDAAFQDVMESFVQYDFPLHSKLQYLDDMGIIMFTKYFLRIQKVLAKLIKDKPLNTLTMVLADAWMAGLPVVTDAFMLARLGNNPLDLGAAKYPETLLDVAPINAALGLLK